MTYGLWLSAAGMQANQYRQNTLANNLANVGTVGFKGDLTVLRERAVESLSGGADGLKFRNLLLDNLSGGTFVAPTYHDFTTGALTPTGNPLDVAVHGDGFLAVRDGDAVRYTRDGRFTTNSRNELVLVAGGGRARVLDQAGAPITLLPNGEPPRVAADGTVRQGDAVAGTIGLHEFSDRNTLRKVGANLFEATAGGAQPARNSTLLAGTVERSTVDPIASLTGLIDASRAFQLNANMISMQDTTMGQAVSRVGRMG